MGIDRKHQARDLAWMLVQDIHREDVGILAAEWAQARWRLPRLPSVNG